MGIYIVPPVGDAYDWLQEQEIVELSASDAVSLYDDYTKIDVVPVCLIFSVFGYLASAALTLEEVIYWTNSLPETNQEWFLLKKSTLVDVGIVL